MESDTTDAQKPMKAARRSHKISWWLLSGSVRTSESQLYYTQVSVLIVVSWKVDLTVANQG